MERHSFLSGWLVGAVGVGEKLLVMEETAERLSSTVLWLVLDSVVLGITGPLRQEGQGGLVGQEQHHLGLLVALAWLEL